MTELVAFFDKREDADRAVDALKEAGFVKGTPILDRDAVLIERLDEQENGKVSVTVQADESRLDTARTILNNAGGRFQRVDSGPGQYEDETHDSGLYDNPFTTQRLHGDQ